MNKCEALFPSFMHSYHRMQNTLDLTFMSDESLMSLLVPCLLLSYSVTSSHTATPNSLIPFGGIFLFLSTLCANSASPRVRLCECMYYVSLDVAVSASSLCFTDSMGQEKHATARKKELNIMEEPSVRSINTGRKEG